MADSRFFRCRGPFALGHIARRVSAELLPPANAELLVHDVAALDAAERGDLSLFYDARYSSAMAKTRAGAVLTTRALSRHAPPSVALVLAADPRLAYAQAADLFYPGSTLAAGIDRDARIDPSAVIGADCRNRCRRGDRSRRQSRNALSYRGKRRDWRQRRDWRRRPDRLQHDHRLRTDRRARADRLRRQYRRSGLRVCAWPARPCANAADRPRGYRRRCGDRCELRSRPGRAWRHRYRQGNCDR